MSPALQGGKSIVALRGQTCVYESADSKSRIVHVTGQLKAGSLTANSRLKSWLCIQLSAMAFLYDSTGCGEVLL
jgi:hypothetical protein